MVRQNDGECRKLLDQRSHFLTRNLTKTCSLLLEEHILPLFSLQGQNLMAAEKDKPAKTQAPKAKQARVSQSDVPAYSLDEALRVAAAILDNYAGQPTNPLDVAAAMNLAPNSSHFRMLTGSAIAYGLTSGGSNAPEISLTALASRILAPLEVGDDLLAKREALLTPKIVGQFLNKYNNSPLPPENIAQNVIATMGAPNERASNIYQLIVDGAESLEILQEIKNKKYINLDRNGPSSPKVTLDLSVDHD